MSVTVIWQRQGHTWMENSFEFGRQPGRCAIQRWRQHSQDSGHPHGKTILCLTKPHCPGSLSRLDHYRLRTAGGPLVVFIIYRCPPSQCHICVSAARARYVSTATNVHGPERSVDSYHGSALEVINQQVLEQRRASREQRMDHQACLTTTARE